MKTKSKISGYVLRGAAAMLLFSCVVVALSSAINVTNHPPKLPAPQNNTALGTNGPESAASVPASGTQRSRTLTFADRVAYQRAIEEVYWRHRIWPKERPDTKPSLDAVMSQTQLEKKVEDYLRDSRALEDYWQKPITPDQLQAEIDRMAQYTRQPEVLRELFEALGNDPYVIAECLARPALAERLLRNFYAHDQRFHGELKRRAEADLRARRTVAQMKQTSGQYSEMELVRSDSGQDKENRIKAMGLRMNSREWDENVQRLAAIFGAAKDGDTGPSAALITQIKTGVVSSLQEDEKGYYATAVVKKSKDRLKLATVAWRKQPLESWRARAESQVPRVMAAATTGYTLPTVSNATTVCTDNTWTATYAVPEGRSYHTAVWTGTEMIVWGGQDGTPALNTGGRYNPSTDTWTPTSTTNAPEGRAFHTAVWTGTQMIVWGGEGISGFVNTGGRYNPSTDTWTATSTTNAPAGRRLHSAVWTGTQMIIWGGYTGSDLNTGSRYNPSTDTWVATSTTNAPSARDSHTAVWTGSAMIVWGGEDNNQLSLNTGGRYNPGTDSWTATSTTNAPYQRFEHTAVWSGTEMIVWGGYLNLTTGGRYNPTTDTWIATSATNAPTARYYHTAVWTGSEMVIWGGDDINSGQVVNTGGRYNPSTDSWTATSTTSAPSARDLHTAVWTGTEMIVWGGSPPQTVSSSGGRYNSSTDTWAATSDSQTGLYQHTAVWTGTEMIVWGGWADLSFNITNIGGRYNPSTDSWTATSITNAPDARYLHTAVWTGSAMIVWGGDTSSGAVNTGGRYNPGTDSWIATSTTNAPSARNGHTAVWTGGQMIVWGGTLDSTGGRYSPSTDTWTTTSTTNAPSARADHTAVWTGSQMIVWGGLDCNPSCVYSNTGGRYNPNSDSWTVTSTTNAPDARSLHTAVWTGSQMIIWGGTDDFTNFNTGGRYNPTTDGWTATNTTNAPSPRNGHTAVWTGSQMIVWGGTLDSTGGRYSPGTDTWTATSTTNAPAARSYHTAVWTGSEMIVWGGFTEGVVLNTGGRYCAHPPPTPTPTPAVTTNPATNVASFSATLNGSLNPRGSTTTVYFQYGLTTSYGSNTPMQTQTGNTLRPISANISGLMASHVYHFRIVAHNGGGTSFGSDRTFTTLSATGPPVVITSPATSIASFSATLNGSVDPHGLTTNISFQYGPTTSYGSTTPMQSHVGNTYLNVSANISSLLASHVYHFRIVATNSAGTVYGSDRTFTTLSATGAPVAITNPATNVASSSATLNGSVDPHGLTSSVHFQYGTTTSYGHTTASQTKTGNTYQSVAANIGGLSASTTYHSRVVATNSSGTAYGSDKTFTTP